MRKIIKLIWKKICTMIAKTKLSSYGEKLAVNRYSKFNSRVSVGHYCNFNGIKIQGSGNVKIGNYFHSGQKCWFITDSHNYEGNAIPYDDTYIVKDIVIDDFVWLGSNVMVLGG